MLVQRGGGPGMGRVSCPVSCLELPVLEPEEQSRPRKPTLQPVLQLKARRRLDKVSTARSENPKPCVRHGSCSPGATWQVRVMGTPECRGVSSPEDRS